MSIEKLTITTDEALHAHIAQRIADYQWFAAPQLADAEDPWAYGTDAAYLKSLCDYWLNDYRWEDTLAELNKFDHFLAQI